MIVTIHLLLWILCSLIDNTSSDPKTQVKGGLEGAWSLVSIDDRGNVAEGEEAKNEKIRCVIKGNHLTLIHGRHRDDYLIEIHPHDTPSKLDLIDPSDKKKINHAIYILNDDKLKICVSKKMNPNTSDERPVKFTTKREDNKNLRGLVLFVFKRDK